MKKIVSIALALTVISMAAVAAPQKKKVKCGNQVEISAIAEEGYHFVQWSDGNTNATRTIEPTQSATLTAYFAINKYIITFQNYNGAVLQKDTLDYGAPVAYGGSQPTRPSTAQYSYAFSGWSPNVSSTATGTVTYVAQFDPTVNSYRITFANYDGTVLQSSSWNYGSTPSYSGDTPTKPSTAQYTYTFKGWDKIIVGVTKDTTYYAEFSNTVNSYPVNIYTNNSDYGTTTSSGTYQYGQNITITATPKACYQFVQWSDGNTTNPRSLTVTGTASLTATFELIEYEITVQSDNETQGKTTIKDL